MITLQIFEDRLDRWGGTLERWPQQDRHEAEALLLASLEARERHARMRELEEALALPSWAGGAVERFATVATRRPQQRRTAPALRRAAWSAAAAAALVLGILVGGANTVPVHEEAPDNVLASALDMSTGSADVD